MAEESLFDVFDVPLETLRETVSGDSEKFGIPEFEQTIPIQIPRSRGSAGTLRPTVTEKDAEAAASMVFDPLNFIPFAGISKFFKGGKEILEQALPESGKGMFTAALSNYIPNWYGPIDKTITVFDEMVAKAGEAIGRGPQNAAEAVGARKKATGFAGWSMDAMKNIVDMAISPEKRALYREQGIAGQGIIARELAEGEVRKAFAQVQYMSHIGKQADRVGDVAPAVNDVMRASGVSDYMAYYPGAYRDTVRAENLQGTVDGRKIRMTDQELNIIEEHIGAVWTSPEGGVKTAFKESNQKPLLFMKTPDNINTGMHFQDAMKSGGYVSSMYQVLKKAEGTLTTEDLYKQLQKLEDGAKWKFHPKSATIDDVRENGIWVTGSFTGSAITEGGVNYITKLFPSGKYMTVVSDEHNFFEKLLDKIATKLSGGRATGTQLLDSRLLAATPPMTGNVYRHRKQLGKEAPLYEKAKGRGERPLNKELLEEIVMAEASPKLVAAEANRQRGAELITAGALIETGRATNEKE
jgi:hypothetical protein